MAGEGNRWAFASVFDRLVGSSHEKLLTSVNIKLGMLRFRVRAALASLLLLVFFTGPLVASACTSCCPQSEGQTSVIAPPACCGKCATTVEKAPDPASAATKKAISDPGRGFPSAQPPALIVLTEILGTFASPICRLHSPPPALPAPLRL